MTTTTTTMATSLNYSNMSEASTTTLSTAVNHANMSETTTMSTAVNYANLSSTLVTDTDDENIWFSPGNLIGVLTTVLVPLVFGVIVVVGK
jgi:hypothetical protein